MQKWSSPNRSLLFRTNLNHARSRKPPARFVEMLGKPAASSCPVVYNIFNASALRNDSLNAFDGFPVPTVRMNNGFTYSGAATEIEYKSGAFFGFAFPFSFRTGLEGNQRRRRAPERVAERQSERMRGAGRPCRR